MNRLQPKWIQVLFFCCFFCNYHAAGQNTFPASGNVGIGTSTPSYLLEVRKDYAGISNMAVRNLTSGASTSRYDLVTYTSGSTAVSSLNDNSGSPYYQFLLGSGVTTAYFDAPSFSWRNLSAGNFMTIASSGNVSIGFSAPTSKLDIYTSSANDAVNIRYNAAGFTRLSANSLGAGAYNSLTQAGDAGIIFGGTAAGAGTFGFVISPWSTGLNGLRVDNNGNVGIATANTQGYQLAVNGSAIFVKAVVKTYATWPDYVFNKNYELPTLKSLEEYIAANNHLPGIADASDIEKNGIDIGKTQGQLLKKIEELTLYIISQDKEIEKLKNTEGQLKSLQAAIQNIQGQLEALKNTSK